MKRDIATGSGDYVVTRLVWITSWKDVGEWRVIAMCGKMLFIKHDVNTKLTSFLEKIS